jgi:hypothetical protein
MVFLAWILFKKNYLIIKELEDEFSEVQYEIEQINASDNDK